MSRIKLALDETLEQGYRKADYWLLRFPTNYSETDAVYPDMIAQQILEKWRKSGSTRASCSYFATCDDGKQEPENSLFFLFVSRAGTRINLASIYRVVSAFLDVARDQSAYAFPLDDRKLQEVLEHSSPVQAHQSIVTDYVPEDFSRYLLPSTSWSFISLNAPRDITAKVSAIIMIKRILSAALLIPSPP